MFICLLFQFKCIFKNLFTGRPYLFQVRAFNRVGAGPWSESLEVVSGAGAPDTPNAPRVQCRGPNLAILDWNEPSFNGAMVTEYRLQLAIGKDKRAFKEIIAVFDQYRIEYYPQLIMFFFFISSVLQKVSFTPSYLYPSFINSFILDFILSHRR